MGKILSIFTLVVSFFLSVSAYGQTRKGTKGPVAYEDMLERYSDMISDELESDVAKPEVVRLTPNDLTRAPEPHEARRGITSVVMKENDSSLPHTAHPAPPAADDSLKSTLEEVEKALRQQQPKSPRSLPPAQWASDLVFLDQKEIAAAPAPFREFKAEVTEGGFHALSAMPEDQISRRLLSETIRQEVFSGTANPRIEKQTMEEEPPLLRPKRRSEVSLAGFRYDAIAGGSTRYAKPEPSSRTFQDMQSRNSDSTYFHKSRGGSARYHSAGEGTPSSPSGHEVRP